jgi:hypothetical protein
MQDRQAEVFRLMQCVEVSTKRFYQLEWGEAYLLKPEFLSSLVFVSILVAYKSLNLFCIIVSASIIVGTSFASSL